MRSRSRWRLVWMLGATAAGGALAVRAPAHAAVTYEAGGRVVSVSPDRMVIHIAHDAIPGVMGAMTMSFTARGASQLEGLGPGDRVRFTFTVTDDGRRLLDAVRRAP